MRKELHELGLSTTNLGSPIWVCMALHGMSVFPYMYLVKGKPISDQTDTRLYSCYYYLGPCAVNVRHVACSIARTANIDHLLKFQLWL
jgi:hypothetical protein